MEYAFEIDGTQIDGAGTSSLFTRTIVHGLQTGEADLDGDGSISVEELYDHVLSQLREITPNQTPGKLIETEGSIFIANGVRGIFALGFLSKEIRSALSSPLVGVRKGVIEDLAPLLNDDNPHVRQAAHTALLQLSNDDSDRVMAAAVTVLGGDPLLSNVNIHPGAGQVEKQGASDAPSRPSAHAAAEKQTSKPEPGPQASKYALAEWVDAVQFSTTRLRPGYDELEVDAFIDAVRDTFLRIREQPLTPDAVRNVQFTTTRQRPGYDEEEVDIFLDEVELRLAGMPQASIDHLRPPDDAVTSTEATEAARAEGVSFGELVARDAPALWLEAVLARKPRMPSDLEARMLQNSSLPIDALLQDRVRDALRRGFWTGLESAR